MLRAALAALVVAVWVAGAVAGEPGGDVSRDGVWRAIFQRPVRQPPTPEMRARIELGSALFFDVRLSGDGTRSCASCHRPEKAFTDGRATGAGRSAPLTRNVPTLYNLADATAFNWDGRAATLEAQARGPITHPEEMAGDLSVIVGRLAADPAAVASFGRAFPGRGVSQDALLEALAAFERALVSPPTRFDKWVAGEDDALDVTEKAGLALFVGKGGCVACHGGWRFTDDRLHDIGLARARADGPVAFKVPTLREITRTAPYMHDGSLPDLEAVLRHYAGGLERRSSLSPSLPASLSLDAGERAALIAFLRTLSSR